MATPPAHSSGADHGRPTGPPPLPGAAGPAADGRPAISIAQFQQLIRDRYFATDSARGTPGTFLLFMEEVGELATAFHDNRAGKSPTPEQRANLEEEFADVLAWLATLANINGVSLEGAVRKYTEVGRVEGVKD